jgi:hypothetical protein
MTGDENISALINGSKADDKMSMEAFKILFHHELWLSTSLLIFLIILGMNRDTMKRTKEEKTFNENN